MVAWQGTCTALQTAIQLGPVSVAVYANNWQFYSSGVHSACNRGQYADHAVVVVGWNKTSGNWYIRNSWATTWGINGYMQLKSGNCNRVCE